MKPENEIKHQQHKHRILINHNKRTDLERSIVILVLNFYCGSKHFFVRLVERSSNSLRNCAISPEPYLVAHTSNLSQNNQVLAPLSVSTCAFKVRHYRNQQIICLDEKSDIGVPDRYKHLNAWVKRQTPTILASIKTDDPGKI